jgi:glycosyltransferase involved in cell wall biosynthesis
LGNIAPGATREEGAVSRVWRKNELLYPLRIVRGIDRRSNGSDTIVHVYHHFNLYGGTISVILFPLLLLLLRLRGYRVVVQPQSVIDPRELRTLNQLHGGRISPWLVTAGLRLFYRALARLSDRLVVCTPSMKQLLVERYGIAANRIWTVPVGWRQITSTRVGLDSKELLGLQRWTVIMFHGFLDPTKGLGDLLDAFAQVHREYPNTHLVFAGEVSPHLERSGVGFLPSLQRRVVDLGLADAVTFTGYVDECRLSQILSTADLFVLPYTMLGSHGGSASLSRVAGFGKPLVASRISRFSDEIVDGETGLLVPPGTPKEIAAAISRILGDPILGDRLGDNLRRLAKERTWQTSAQLLDGVLYPSLESISPT